MAQRRHNFISGAAVLALAVAVTKVLGALYKIPLGNLLDKEGMAHFYAAYNIYNLLLVLSTAGLPLALSRLVSRAAAQGRLNAQRRIFRTALALLAVIGAVCSAVMCLFPQVLSGLLHDSLAAPAIRVLGPAVLFVCLTSAIRGYTQGLGDMTPTAVSQMTESAGKLVIGLALCLVLLHRGADSSLCAAGAIAGVTAGSLLSLTVLTVFLLRRRDRAAVDVPPARSAVLRELLTAGIPITLGAAGMSLITLLDQALVMSTLQNTLGYTEAAATALYGEYTFGMTLFALPPSFIYPVTVSLVPDISAALARGDRPAAGRSAAAALKLTTLIALPTGAGLSVLAGPILRLLYPAVPDTAAAAAYHLTILGIACIFVCLMVATNGVLQAYGKEYIPVVTLLCGGILKIITNYLMVGDPATTKLDMVNDIEGVNAVSLESVLDLVNELVYDKVDAILVDGGVAQQYADANPDLVICSASSELPTAEPYCIAVAKGDPKGLLDGINAALAKMASENKIETFIADADALASVAVEVSAD